MPNKQHILETIHKSQDAVLKQINKVASNEQVKKTTKMACDYGQRLAHDVMKELQKQGKLTAKETKKLIAQVNKRAKQQKGKLQKSLKTDSERLLKSSRSVIVNALALTKKYAIERLSSVNGNKRTTKRKTST